MADDAFDLSQTYVHLGVGATALPIPDFSWDTEHLASYLRRFADERDEQRLVGIVALHRSWSHWERHLGGDEVVVQLSGRSDVIQDLGGEYRTLSLHPGQAMINPRGVWHTADVHEAGQTLFIAGGRRTTYRPRATGQPA
jgi:hypothetical protein